MVFRNFHMLWRFIIELLLFSQWLLIHFLLCEIWELIWVKVFLWLAYARFFRLRGQLVTWIFIFSLVFIRVQKIINFIA